MKICACFKGLVPMAHHFVPCIGGIKGTRHAIIGHRILPSSSMSTFLNIQRQADTLILTMNQPELRNPLTGNSAVEEFLVAFDTVADDRSIKVVILTGNGPAFSTGGNVKDMGRYLGDSIKPSDIRQDYRRGIQRLALGLYNLEVPTIAAVNGPAMGAGLDLSCMCDIRIAAESAKFCEAFVNVGIIPGDGGAWLLPRVLGQSKAAEMAFTGEVLNAQQALACGLVSQVVADDDLMSAAMALAERIASKGADVLRMTKRLMREAQHVRLEAHLEMAASFQAIAHKTAEHQTAVENFTSKNSK